MFIMGQDGVVSMVTDTGWTADELWFDSQQGCEIFSSKHQDWLLGTPSTLFVGRGGGGLFLWGRVAAV
jgi:hypothetical protein